MYLAQFDDSYEVTCDGLTVHDDRVLLNARRYQPRGATALLDALARAVKATRGAIETRRLHDTPQRVIVAVITDGQENASRNHTLRHLFDMIDHQRRKHGWEFLFLGANQDAIATAARLGIAPDSAMTFRSSAAGTRAMYGTLSRAVTATRTRGGSVGLADPAPDSRS